MSKVEINFCLEIGSFFFFNKAWNLFNRKFPTLINFLPVCDEVDNLSIFLINNKSDISRTKFPDYPVLWKTTKLQKHLAAVSLLSRQEFLDVTRYLFPSARILFIISRLRVTRKTRGGKHAVNARRGTIFRGIKPWQSGNPGDSFEGSITVQAGTSSTDWNPRRRVVF